MILLSAVVAGDQTMVISGTLGMGMATSTCFRKAASCRVLGHRRVVVDRLDGRALNRPSSASTLAASTSVTYFTNSKAASFCFDGAAMKTPSTVIQGRMGLPPASLMTGSGASP